jgi:hypothetical protein
MEKRRWRETVTISQVVEERGERKRVTARDAAKSPAANRTFRNLYVLI